jgi:hypothetical protein
MLLHRGQGGGGDAVIRGLSPAAWFRLGQGITTVTGVSQWADQSGNARHLKQATGAAQPALQADGSILFDGTDDYLKCDAFTLPQPVSVYMLGRQVTWTLGDVFFDGDVRDGMIVFQRTSSPTIAQYTGVITADNSDFTLNAYAVLSSIYNGASSSLQINSNAATTGVASATTPGGFTLGAGGNAASFANIQVKEVIVFQAAHTAAQRASVIGYLTRIGGL